MAAVLEAKEETAAIEETVAQRILRDPAHARLEDLALLFIETALQTPPVPEPTRLYGVFLGGDDMPSTIGADYHQE